MWARLITAFLCLFAFTAELTLDTSTSFVRSEPRPAVGKLVVVKNYAKMKSAGKPPVDCSKKCPSDNNNPDHEKYGTPSSHAGNIPAALTFDQTIVVTALFASPESAYEEPRLGDLQRPPSAQA